ncbi:hypothetical protein [Streptomyces sp. NPDC004546]|uniref:hypothetical protein n=1 Tax=Streptomyces sp. NPDC004546 TaxID=3154282 RepID=UPI0033AA86A6
MKTTRADSTASAMNWATWLVVVSRDDHQGGLRQSPDQSGQPRTGEGGGQSRRDDQQRAQVNTGAYADVRHRDGNDQCERDHQQPAPRALLQEAVSR